jgi:hypothetical protein
MAFAMFVLLSVSPASAQYVAAIEACRRDINQYCASGAGVAECIKSHFQDLAKPCQAALVRIAAVRDACAADIQAQCRGIKRGEGRILLCVREHFAALSEPCKDAIAEAAKQKVGTR